MLVVVYYDENNVNRCGSEHTRIYKDLKTVYDYLANNYYKMSKEELKDIAKELLYGIYVYDTITKTEHDEILKSIGEELEEQYEE